MTDKATVFFATIHYMGFIQNMKLSITDDLFQMVSEELPPNINSLDTVSNSLAKDIWNNMSKTEATIDHNTTLFTGKLQFISITGKISRMCSQKTLESKFLEKYLTKSFLNRGEVEVWFSKYQVQIIWSNIETIFAKNIIPNSLLMIPVHKVALLKWKEIEER